MDKIKRAGRTNPYSDITDNAVLIFFACVMAGYYYGADTVRLIVFTAAASLIGEILSAVIYKLAYKTSKLKIDIFGGIFSGCITALICPGKMPVFLPPIIMFVSTVAVKAVYPLLSKKQTTGVVRYDISSALTAIALLSAIFFRFTFAYSSPSAYGINPPNVTQSVLRLLADKNTAGLVKIGTVNIVTGNAAGPVGTGCFLLMMTAFVYIMMRRKKYAVMPFFYVLGTVIFALLFKRADFTVLNSVLYELSGGIGLFIAVYVMSDKKYQPRNVVLSGILGLAAAILSMILRRVSFIEDWSGIVFLAVNIASVMINSSTLLKKPKKGYAGKRSFKMPDDTDELDELLN